MSLPAVSKHLKVLERAGLIARCREAQWRPCRIDPQRAQGHRRLARTLSPLLRRKLRSPRRLPEEAAGQSDRKPRAKNMAAKSSLDLDNDPRSIIGIREFDAPRDLVFSVWTDPKHLAQWWGPNGFHHHDVAASSMRPGGVWRFVMHGPDGRDYQNRITFDEIVPPERIVYRHGGGEDVEPVQFTPDGRFRGSWRQDAAHLASRFPVGGRARSRDQGIRRRRGPGADHGADGRLCGGDGGICRIEACSKASRLH